ncbi:MAG: glycosyltransferase [Ruminiclostridium sp.]|nr:glycosyltransferase [Ruminiclostridium sp.]
MKLTIGMIVKNEEKWLDKCLSAIKPILDNVDSELIITDTGSSDGTVDIAQKYTKNILHFDWCDDFSAARNFGLKKAHGEWFMMLDADDIFRSCDNIIEFFNSGEYKKYNAATYRSRNLLNTENGVGYSDLWVPRLIKIRENTRYEGYVHEYLTTFDPPYKNLPDIADHYGYLYEDDEARYSKFKRNSELLLKRYEAEKETSPMLFVQLYEAYMAIEETDTALAYLDEGIKLASKMNSIVLISLYFHKISYYYTEKNYDATVDLCVEYFNISKKIRPHKLTTDGEIYAIKARSLSVLGKFDEAIAEYKKFLDIYKEIGSGRLATYDSYLVSNFMCTDINWLPLFNDFLSCCISAGRFNTAESYMTSYPLYKYSFESKEIALLIINEITVIDHFGYKSVDKYYSQLDETGKKLLAELLLVRMYISEEKAPIFSAVNESADNNLLIKYASYKKYLDRDVENIVLAEIVEFIVSTACHSLEICNMHYSSLLAVDIRKVINDIARIGGIIAEKNCSEYTAPERAAIKIADSVRLAKSGDIKGCVTVMKDAVKEYEPIAPIVSEYCDKLLKNIEAAKPASEMEQLAAAVKNNIRAMIDSGNYEQARKTLAEYRQINPKDVEIGELEAMLQGK